MRKAAAAKKLSTVVKEHEQLFLVRKPVNDLSGKVKGFRHHTRD
jgi:hypothetical protein